MSAVKRVELDSDRMAYIIPRGRWCHIIVLNVSVPKEEKIHYFKDSFYKKLECVFDKFHILYEKFYRIQCQSRQRRHSQTNNWKCEITLIY
jgi:hypothetical protein